MDILIAGRSKEELKILEEMLGGQGNASVRTRHVSNGHVDPLYNLSPLPDVLVLSLSVSWKDELEALSARDASERPPTLVVGPSDDAAVMRKAMRAGARDFFTHPVDAGELVAALEQIARDLHPVSTGRARTTVVVNAKGGAGASIIASNIAHILVACGGLRTMLVDMDLQFGALPLNFNQQPNDGLLQATELVDTLDLTALDGWALKHQSGLRLLGTSHKTLVLPNDVSGIRLKKLLDLLVSGYEQLVVDLPRQIDHLFATTVGHADTVVVVMQQSVAHLRDAGMLVNILKNEFMVPIERIIVVINRWDKNDSISLKDIERGMKGVTIRTLPNDYTRVEHCADLGVPLYEVEQSAPITKALIELAGCASGKTFQKPGFFKRLLHREDRDKWT